MPHGAFAIHFLTENEPFPKQKLENQQKEDFSLIFTKELAWLNILWANILV